MIKKHIEAVFLGQANFIPTDGQKRLISCLSSFISSDVQDKIFIIKGYAGTGKTTMISLIVKSLHFFKFNIVLLAPTGRAAKILSGYTNLTAYTIHKKIYRQKSSTDGLGEFILDKNLNKNTFFIVDESSMISNQVNEGSNFGSGRLLDDLVEYVYSGLNCRLILVGDTAQLPPVKEFLSPALNRFELEQYGFEVEEFELTEVVRQSKESGILINATHLREIINSENPLEGYFQINIQGFDDVIRITGEDLIENISECYDRYGVYETSIITYSNKRANLYNKGIRNSILNKESEISKGDLLMVVRNNYYWTEGNEEFGFIANGDVAELISIHKFESLYNFRFADVTLSFIDYDNFEIDCKILLDTLDVETPSLGNEEYKRLYQSVSEDFLDIKNKKKRWEKIRENPYFNALQIKFAYALTCHKSQGGQWKSVFVDQGYLSENMITIDYLRWMYTAFTRSVEKLYFVNFNDKFFQENN